MEAEKNYLSKKIENENKFKDVLIRTGYPGTVTPTKHIIGPPHYFMMHPEKGSEIFAKIPVDMFEDELFNFFNSVSPVYQMKLLMCISGLFNRGIVYVTYCTAKEAQLAINELSKKEIRPSLKLTIRRSSSNSRLFIGNVPTNKSRDEIWNELINLGFTTITNVISYPGYELNQLNRGFVFIDFITHEEAAKMRNNNRNFVLFGSTVVVDWSIPLPEIKEEVMSNVKILYVSNLSVTMDTNHYKQSILSLLDPERVTKIYKFKNYSFIHLTSREYAEVALKMLKDFFAGTDVEVTWAKPRSYINSPEYRRLQVNSLKNKKRSSSVKEPLEVLKMNKNVEVKYDFYESENFLSENFHEDLSPCLLYSHNFVGTNVHMLQSSEYPPISLMSGLNLN